MIKKIIMSLGAISASLIPLASLIACGDNDSSSPSGQKESGQIQDNFEKLTLDLTQIQTPKELIDKILEKSNLKYPKNFLDILEVDDFEKATKLTDTSQKAFVDYYQKIKPLKVTLKDANSAIEATLDLSEEVKIIEKEIENHSYVEDYEAASSKVSKDAVDSIIDPSKTSPNISAYIGKMHQGLGYDMLPMRIVSDKAWKAYMQELDDIHKFIWKIVSSKVFKNWNKGKEYELIQGQGGMGQPIKIEKLIQKSGKYFDESGFDFSIPRPKLPNESSNLEAAFAISFLNLFAPLETKEQETSLTETIVAHKSRKESKKYWHQRRQTKRKKSSIKHKKEHTPKEQGPKPSIFK